MCDGAQVALAVLEAKTEVIKQSFAHITERFSKISASNQAGLIMPTNIIDVETGDYCGKSFAILPHAVLSTISITKLVNDLRIGNQKMPFDQIMRAIELMVKNVAKLHDAHIIHGDIRSGTIRLSSTGNLEIGCWTIPLVHARINIPGSGKHAPEVAISGPSTASDIWSIGAIASELLKMSSVPLASIPNFTTDLIARMLDPSPSARPIARDIITALERSKRGLPISFTQQLPVWHTEPVFLYITTAVASAVVLPSIERIIMTLASLLSLSSSQLHQHIPVSIADLSMDSTIVRIAIASEQAVIAMICFMHHRQQMIDPFMGTILDLSFTEKGEFTRSRDQIRTELMRVLTTPVVSAPSAGAGAGGAGGAGAGGAGGGAPSVVSLPPASRLSQLVELRSPQIVFKMNSTGKPELYNRTSTSTCYTGELTRETGKLPVFIKVPSNIGVDVLATEMYPISQVKHTALTEIFGITRIPGEGAVMNFGLVMQHYKYNLGTEIREGRAGAMSMTKRLQIILDIAQGIAHLHSNKIYHTNIKPELIGFDDDKAGKITDLTPALPESVAVMSRGMRGSPMYMCPALASGTDCISMATDVFSIAITLWEVIELKSPYKTLVVSNVHDFFDHVRRGVRPGTPEALTATLMATGEFNLEKVGDLVKMITECWDSTPKNRPTITHVVAVLQRVLKPVIIV